MTSEKRAPKLLTNDTIAGLETMTAYHNVNAIES